MKAIVAAKLAVTLLAASMVTEQAPEPVQARSNELNA